MRVFLDFVKQMHFLIVLELMQGEHGVLKVTK